MTNMFRDLKADEIDVRIATCKETGEIPAGVNISTQNTSLRIK
jgi:hypothetical protein